MTGRRANIKRFSALLLSVASVVHSNALAQEQIQQAEKSAPPLLDASSAESNHGLKRLRKNQLGQLHISLRFEQYRSQVEQQGFSVVEEALQSNIALAEGNPEAVVELAIFYMAHGLNEEALSLFGEQCERVSDERFLFLAGVAAYQAGRYEIALSWFNNATLQHAPEIRPWRGMAYAALGAYQAAAPDLFSARAKDAGVGATVSQFYLARASTAIALQDAQVAAEALSDLRRTTLNERQRGERALLEARHQLLLERPSAARDILTRLSKYGEQPASSHAELILIALEAEAAKMPPAVAAMRVETLLLQWRGGAFEREALFYLGEFCEAGGKFECSFKARRRLQNGYPHADVAKQARPQMTALLERLAGETTLSPLTAAQIFYDNIDLAPPGRDGDQLIQRLVRDLVALDLHTQAAELLEHQVFNRLRGAERSTAASDLAEIYLNSDRPREALRVLRSTRFAKLPDNIVAWRRLMEATSLWRTNQIDAALALLDEDGSVDAMRLRGDIYWQKSDWALAGKAYATATQVVVDGAAFEDLEHDLVLRAAAALSLAGDDDGLASFYDAIAPKITDAKVLSVLSALKDGAPAETLTQFSESYRAVFSGGKSES